MTAPAWSRLAGAASLGALAAFAAAAGCGSDAPSAEGFQVAATATDAGVRDVAREGYHVAWDGQPYEGPKVETSNPGPPYPIILHHGFSGWKEIGALGLHYFNGVVADLAAHGEIQVFESAVDPYAATEVRAKQLAPFVDGVLAQTGKDKVNIIAHSQGGMDSRFLVSSLRYGERVATLTMIATPNRGTAIADGLFNAVPDWTDDIVNAIANLIGRSILDIQADSDLRASLESLSEDKVVHEFNLHNPDDPRVAYFSYTGRSGDASGVPDCDGSVVLDDPSRVDHVDPLLSLTNGYLGNHGVYAGVNDGMVTVKSARWGLFMGCVPADHFDEIGQVAKTGPNPESGFDHKAFYRDVVKRLRDRGF
jgi:triacylglycerol lipase